MRGDKLAELLSRGSPEAFEVVAELDGEGRGELVEALRGWLGGTRQASRLPLLAWIDEAAWPELVAQARAATASEDELVRERGRAVLDEAARQVPGLFGEAAQPARHLAFPPGHVTWRWPHPTQVAPPDGAPRQRFGGTLATRCGFCDQPLHHLLAHAGLALATCLSCVGWEQPLGDYALSYQHDADGVPHALDRLATPLIPRFPAAPFVETEVAVVELAPRFWRQDWGTAMRGANLHRVGGAPTWVQAEELRPCRGCAAPMAVVLQLDSELPQSDGRTFSFGSGGVLFVELCAACRITTTLWQCT